MSVVNISSADYLKKLTDGSLDMSVSYTVDGDMRITGKTNVKLQGVRITGSVKISEDCQDAIIQGCDVVGDVVCNAANAVIKECRAREIILGEGATNVLAAKCECERVSATGAYNCAIILNKTALVAVWDSKNIYVIIYKTFNNKQFCVYCRSISWAAIKLPAD